jgi:ABC-2 type transport system ATP-binding protein
MRSSEPVLDVADLSKSFGARTVVSDITFSIFPGEIVGIVGPNGAGKTTIINMILAVLAPTAGRIEIGGYGVARQRSAALGETNFAAAYAPLPGNLTVEQNLRIFGLIYGVRNLGARIEALLAEYDLKRYRATKCGVLSSGEQSRAALAKAMLNSPKLLLLDEPTASIDPATARVMRNHIVAFARERRGAVLWTSHNMYEVSETCDRILFLSRGRILLAGAPDKLIAEHGDATLEDLFVRVANETLMPADEA